jgi:hypothetical protein
MTGRYEVKVFKNGVKHFWDNDVNRCIHWSKVKDRISAPEFDKLFEQFGAKLPKQTEESLLNLPPISEILGDVIRVYSEHISVEEIVGALELSKAQVIARYNSNN